MLSLKSCFQVLCFVSALSACNNSNVAEEQSISSSEDPKIMEEEIKATLIAMWDAIEKKNIDSYAMYIHPDFTQFGETDPVLSVGKESEIKGVENWLSNASNIHTEMLEPIVTIKGEVAWITYYWSDSGITNGEAFASKGKSTRIFVREQGKWLCIHGHYTLL